MNKIEAEILGKFAADGHLYKEKNKGHYEIGFSDGFLNTQLKKNLETTFKVPVNIYRDKRSYAKYLKIFRKEVWSWFYKYFGEKTCYSVHIPSIIFQSDIEIQQAFLFGYLHGDGWRQFHYSRNKLSKCTWVVKTVSKQMASDLLRLLKNLNWPVVSCKKRFYPSKTRNNSPYYEIVLHGVVAQ